MRERYKDKIVNPDVQYRKDDPVLWHQPGKQRMEQAVFGWYVSEHGCATNHMRPICVIFLPEQPRQPQQVQVSDIEPWVHSSRSMPTDASEDS